MTSSETTFNDAELIEWLRAVCTCNIDSTPCMAEDDCRDAIAAADRIEALIEESARRLALARSEGVARVEQFERNEALTEQLAAARHDAKEAEAYAEEVEKERDDYAHKLMQANNTYTEMHVEIERLSDKLAKAVAGLEKCQEELDEYSRQEYPLDHPVHERYRQRDYDANTARATLAEISSEAALNKGESRE